MSAAIPRAERLESGTREPTQPSKDAMPGELGGPPVVEVTRVAATELSLISEHGMTPLMRAACDGSAGTVQALLDREAEINAKRSDGFNALAMAAFFGHSQVVWLLLENGADLTPTSRSRTLPEMWADTRGFLDIGDMLREARATKQLEAPSSHTTVIDEPARFSRATEHENQRRSGAPEQGLERSVIEEATDSETTLAVRPRSVAEENLEKGSESTSSILPSAKLEQAQQQPVIHHPPRALKTLPEIIDPPPLVVPEFHPGSAFMARITSSPKNVAALILVVLLVCGGTAALLIPQIRNSLADGRKEGITKTNDLTAEPNTVSETGANVSSTVETSPATTSEPTTTAASGDTDETTSDAKSVDSPSRLESAEVSEKGSTGIATTPRSESGDNRRTSTSAGYRVPEAGKNRREFSAGTSLSRPAAPARKLPTVSRSESKQQAVTEEQPKPAPLSVEGSRSRRAPSTQATSSNEVPGSQPPPLNIITGKPKSKVIQWPP